MSKNNKPQWLLDAEKTIQEFEDSKYGKMTQAEYNKRMQFENSFLAKSMESLDEYRKTGEFIEMQKELYQRAIKKNPNMHSKGGKQRAKSFTKEHQSYAASCRNPEKLKKSSKKAAAVSAANRKKNTEILKQKLYDLIELDSFTIYDLENLIQYFDEFNDLQMFRKYLRDTSRYEIIGYKNICKPGPNPKLYKKK